MRMSGQAEYDDLDVFVNEWLAAGEIPGPTIELGAGMVEFYKTPARVVVEMIGRIDWKAGDVFVDLGAGLGQVAILVHLMTGVRALGIEIEAAYCAYARQSAEVLGLTGAVKFVDGDVRAADLSSGSAFFLFTPFKGEVFDQVMDKLRAVAASRRIKVIGYGPCSADMARLDWLQREGEGDAREYELQIFTSG
jgi:hypothetical protein